MDESSACKSFFKSGVQAPSAEAVTELWIRLINQTEESKAMRSNAEQKNGESE